MPVDDFASMNAVPQQIPEDELLLRELHERRKAAQAASDHHRSLLAMNERIVEMTSAAINTVQADGPDVGAAQNSYLQPMRQEIR